MTRPIESAGTIVAASSDTRLGAGWGGLSLEWGLGQEGDLVLVQVVSESGAYSEVENVDGMSISLRPGDRFIGVLGNRESGKYLAGGVPPNGVPIASGTVLDLLTNGGIVGICASAPEYLGVPLQVRCLGLITKGGRRVSTLARLEGGDELGQSVPIVLVAATSTDVGKTTCATRMVSSFARAGYRVGAAKLSGTGCLEDIEALRAAGAHGAIDFPDVGLPSTYTSREFYMRAIRHMVRELNGDDIDVIIGELGGDIVWANVPTLLKMPDFMRFVCGIVVIAGDAVAAIGTASLFSRWGVETPVHYVSSPFQNHYSVQLRLEMYLGHGCFNPRNVVDMERLAVELRQAAFGTSP